MLFVCFLVDFKCTGIFYHVVRVFFTREGQKLRDGVHQTITNFTLRVILGDRIGKHGSWGQLTNGSGWKEGNVLFNDALNTFYLRLYGVRHMVKYHSDSERKPVAAT